MRGFRFLGGAAALASLALALSACGGGSNPQTPGTLPAAGDQAASLAALGGGLIGHPPPHPPTPVFAVTATDFAQARAGGWQGVAAAAPFGKAGAGTALLMTDGTVMIGNNAANWYTLTPNSVGSYAGGTWKQEASLPAGYGPLYFASAVLADGKLIINGGEYNFGAQTESNLGAIYDPIANTWKKVPAPAGWSQIGDAQSVVLSNGTYMLGNCCTSTQALYNESTNRFTATGNGKADANSEEGWTLLPNAKVLTADVTSEPDSELYTQTGGSWASAGSLLANLTAAFEIGPQTLRPDGTVLVVGANKNTAIYNTATGVWTAGPALPIVGGKQLDSADGPATVLPNGQVLVALSPGVYQRNTSFFIFNGTKFTQIASVPNAKNDSSYNVRLLALPNGQVLETDGSNDVEIYSSRGAPDTAIAPAVSSVATTLLHATTYPISGVRFNGFTQNNTYGDDAQASSNYPLVEIVNNTTNHVFFARTHGHSSMAVASQATVSTNFDVPSGIELGEAKLYVIANGIKSAPVSVTVK